MSRPGTLADFPVHRIHPDRELYRIHRHVHGPLWFASTASLGEGGRFELPDSSSFGTCYLATSPVGAYLEKFGRIRTLTEELLLAHRLSVLAPTVSLDLADLTDRTALGDFRITAEISTGTDYVPSQEFAMRLWESGFDGIYYAARHDPSLTERSVALFGPAGDQTVEYGKHFDLSTSLVPRGLVEQVATAYHLRVLPTTRVFDGDGHEGL